MVRNPGTIIVRPALRIVFSERSFSTEPTGTPTLAKSIATSASPLRTNYADKRVGDCFEFGLYPQGANGEIKPITWRVLRRKADHLLVIAEQGLDCKRYHEELFDLFNNTWADCTLRRWLNDEFMNVAFNEQERKCVLKTSIDDNAGPDSADYIFLLSVDEAKSLFANDIERRAKPTECAVKNGALTDDNGYCFWSLRSYCRADRYATHVYPSGDINDFGFYLFRGHGAVRPALNLAL